jgi:general secretion pathway protein K
VALLVALLIVSLATVTALGIVSGQQIGVARTANLLHADQAYLYALGAEDIAATLIAAAPDARDTGGAVRHLRLQPSFDEPGVTLATTIEDMQGRFNLNNLVKNGRANSTELARFRRLLRVLGLDPSLADAVVDWIDADATPRSTRGAEDGLYLRRTPGHRSANAPLVSASELRLLPGFSPQVLHTLAPQVAALPETTPVNVNSASQALLMALADGISAQDARKLLRDRAAAGFASIGEFMAHPAIAGKPGAAIATTLTSRYFEVTTEASFGRGRVRLRSLLRRDPAGRIEVRMRHRDAD